MCLNLQGAIMLPQNWSDEDLARSLQERNLEAFETLISRYSREIFYFVRLVLEGIGVAQDAEECVNDLFITVWQEIDTFDSERGTLRTWLTMRAKYIALDRRRQLCRRQTLHVQSADETRQWTASDGSSSGRISGWGGHDYENRVVLPPHPESSMESLLEQSERREELRLALATLPELDRYLIYQRYFKFASTEELATKTGLTRHAVDTRLWRARKSLREALKEHTHELNSIFSPEQEELPPYFVQNLLASEDQLFRPVEPGFEHKTRARVFRRLKLHRRLFHAPRSVFDALITGLSNIYARGSLLVSAIAFMLIMLVTVAFTVPSFVTGMSILLRGSHGGVYQVSTYPKGVHTFL